MHVFRFGEEQQSKVRPNVVELFAACPDAARLYGAIPLYHMTHSMNVPGITEHGLAPNPQLFPKEHVEFLLRMYDRYSYGHPGTRLFITDRIEAGNKLYLSNETPNPHDPHGYGVPERLMLLMRSLHSLQEKQSLTPGEAAYARQAYAEHYEHLTSNDPTLTAVQVDPFAPAVINSRIGGVSLAHFEDLEAVVDTFEWGIDRYPHNIEVTGTIEPAYVSRYGDVAPLDVQALQQNTTIEATWLSSIQ